MNTDWNKELQGFKNLDNLKGSEPYTAPDGYFEKFAAGISDTISNQKVSWSASFLKYIMRPVVYIPSLAVIAIGLIWFNYTMINDSIPAGCVASSEESYNDAVIDEVDETSLCDYIASQNDVIATTTNDEELLENISEETLINEL